MQQRIIDNLSGINEHKNKSKHARRNVNTKSRPLRVPESTSSSYPSLQCLQCYNHPQSHSTQVWRLKRVLRLFITHTSHAEHSRRWC